MTNFLRFWLSFSLLITLSLQQSAPLVFRDSESPKIAGKQLLVRGARYHNESHHVHLEPERKDSFHWTGMFICSATKIKIIQGVSQLLTSTTASQNGQPAFAEFAVETDDDTSVVSMERFKSLLRSVHCTNTSLAVNFKNQKTF